MDWTKIPYAKECVEKQCEIANIEFDEVDFDDDGWVSDNTWTSDQSNQFKKWVLDYFKNNIKARRELCTMPALKSKKHLEKLFDSWNFMYGFRIKDD